MDDELSYCVENYLKLCFTAGDQQQIENLISKKQYEELQRRMLPRISFGTSGLRGRLEAGYARMNDLTVYQASIGLREYVLSKVPRAAERGVVVGHDHRHHSSRFAEIVRSVFASKMGVFGFDCLVHTPLVPFAVKQLNATCGVMITASHNPKQDNGYKVYWENACAIIPPHDQGISDAIDRAAECQTPLTEHPAEKKARYTDIYAQIVEEYFKSLRQTLQTAKDEFNFKFCYTPMHGVGLPFARRATSLLVADGSESMIVVSEQAEPDPEFSTVRFPNPEEKGALDLAMATADSHGLSLVVATDPDADRLVHSGPPMIERRLMGQGIAEKVHGTWHILTGNQIGALLAHEMIGRTSSLPNRALLSSAVSSRLLEKMGQMEGIHWEETLTGFKWLGNRALTLKEQGHNVIFSYEEALGFMPYDIVYDKDGILSMTVLLSLARTLYAKGSTLVEELGCIYDKYGHFATANGYITIADPRNTVRIMTSLREPMYPSHLAGRPIMRVRDLTRGYDSSTPSNHPLLPVSATSEMLTFWFAPRAQGTYTSACVTVRGSGTEPKLKYYIEAQAESLKIATAAAQEIEADVVSTWFGKLNLSEQSRP